ncbi:MAG: RHS repeat protein [Bacteroidetes bacterium]|nr:RHS repeat protein [Bacteroidota bacterium]
MSFRLAALTLIFQISFHSHLFGQFTENGSPLKISVIPPSPEAASLGKYGENGVGYYTGVPEISIPIANVQGLRLSLPIDISYHSGGIKVEEVASRVGLGWSLNAGGVITRTVRGLPDDEANGWIGSSFNPEAFLANPLSTQFATVLADIANGLIDAEPDIFYFNFNKKSGSFYFDKNKAVVTIPHSRIIILPTFSNGRIIGWVITDVDGTKYYFGKSKDGLRAPVEQSINTSACSATFPNQSITDYSSWFLADFCDYNSDECISLYYEDYQTTSCLITSQTRTISVGATNGPQFVECYSSQTVNGKRLIRIESNKQFASFKDGVAREDLIGDHVLDSITVVNLIGAQVIQPANVPKKTVFNYSYFVSSEFSPVVSCSQTNARLKRLKLTYVKVQAGSLANEQYDFTYDPTLLPERLSFAQDHCGFFNGKTSNSSLIPEFEQQSANPLFVAGADRSVSDAFAKACILTKIKYPTGGVSVFEYEGNSAVASKLEGKYQTMNTSLITPNGALQANYSTPFTVNSFGKIGAFVEFQISGVNCSLTEFTCGISFDVAGVTDTNFALNLNNLPQPNPRVFLPNGTYSLNINVFAPNPNIQNFSILGKWKQFINDINKPAGGLRIKSIKNYSGETLISNRSFEYVDLNDPLVSSGIITNVFSYAAYKAGYDPGIGQSEQLYELSSISKIPLGTTHGSSVGYGRVSEYFFSTTPSDNGRTDYNFITSNLSPDLDSPDPDDLNKLSVTPSFNRDWTRGLPLKTVWFAKMNSVLLPIKEQTTSYSDIVTTEPTIGIVVTPFVRNYSSGFKYGFYRTGSGTRKPKDQATITYVYDKVTNALLASETILENYYYDNLSHLEVTRKETLTSKGELSSSQIKYASDLAPSSVTTDLINKNVISIPLETSLSVGGSGVNGRKDAYSVSNGKLRLTEVYLGELVNGNLTYTKAIDHSYFDNGNLKSSIKSNDYTTSYLWGYNARYPIAEVANAGPDKIFYTGFEENGTLETPGFLPKSGHRYLNTGTYNFQVQAGFSPAVTIGLKMSYWYWANSKWNFIEKDFSNVINDGSRLDDIRVYPAGAFMTTYVYNSNGLVESVTDHNGKSSRYFYDQFYRLISIKDNDGNIMKAFDYHFKAR